MGRERVGAVTGNLQPRPTVTHFHKATPSDWGECNAGGVFTKPNLRLTTDPAAVTCGSCKLTRRWRAARAAQTTDPAREDHRL